MQVYLEMQYGFKLPILANSYLQATYRTKVIIKMVISDYSTFFYNSILFKI